MRTSWKWLSVFAAATAVDLFVRFGFPFRLTRVLAVEAVLFPLTGLVFLFLMRRDPARTSLGKKIQVGIVAAFFLAGFRSGLWASGLPIGKTNLAVLAMAVVIWMTFKLRSRTRS